LLKDKKESNRKTKTKYERGKLRETIKNREGTKRKKKRRIKQKIRDTKEV